LEKKNKKNREFFFCGAADAPDDQAICLFAGLLANPDMPLSLDVSLTSGLRFREV
jgi:hypothetical protein